MRQQMDADQEECLDILGNGDWSIQLKHLQLRDHKAAKDQTESFL